TAARLPKALDPDNRRAGTDIKLLGRRAPRRPAFNFRNHSRPHVFRIGLRHRPASQNRINADRLSHPSPSENLLDSIGTEHALGNDQHITCLLMGTRVRVSPIPWSSPDAYPSGGNPSLSHRWAKWHSRLMAPIESRTPDWRMGFGLQTARTGLKYRNPVIGRTAISRVSKSSRGDLQPGKVAMPRGPRSEKRPPT